MIKNAFSETVVINENGQRRTITKFEASMKQLANKGASGDLRALRPLLELARYAETTLEAAERLDNRPMRELTDEELTETILRYQQQSGLK